MKLAVVGSRDFRNYNLLREKLDTIKDVYLIISGGAAGADGLAEIYAKEKNIPTLIFKAEWNKYGKAAGMIRNEKIIREADTVVAFWNGKSPGTKNSIDLAKAQGKTLIVVFF